LSNTPPLRLTLSRSFLHFQKLLLSRPH